MIQIGELTNTVTWGIFAFTLIISLFIMGWLVFRRAYLLTGSSRHLQSVILSVSIVVLMMGMCLASWYFLAAINPDLIVSPVEMSKFWGEALTIGGFVFITAITTGFLALHMYRGGA